MFGARAAAYGFHYSRCYDKKMCREKPSLHSGGRTGEVPSPGLKAKRVRARLHGISTLLWCDREPEVFV